MKVPLHNVQDSNWLSEGVYELTVTNASYKEINGKQAVIIMMANDLGQVQREPFFLTEKALWRLKKFARACGYEGTNWEEFDTEGLLGCSVMVQLVREPNPNGKWYVKMSDFWQKDLNVPGSPTPPPQPEPPKKNDSWETTTKENTWDPSDPF
jgi:hypothetical protein